MGSKGEADHKFLSVHHYQDLPLPTLTFALVVYARSGPKPKYLVLLYLFSLAFNSFIFLKNILSKTFFPSLTRARTDFFGRSDHYYFSLRTFLFLFLFLLLRFIPPIGERIGEAASKPYMGKLQRYSLLLACTLPKNFRKTRKVSLLNIWAF